MASAELSPRVEKVVGQSPFSELGDFQRREFPRNAARARQLASPAQGKASYAYYSPSSPRPRRSSSIAAQTSRLRWPNACVTRWSFSSRTRIDQPVSLEYRSRKTCPRPEPPVRIFAATVWDSSVSINRLPPCGFIVSQPNVLRPVATCLSSLGRLLTYRQSRRFSGVLKHSARCLITTQ